MALEPHWLDELYKSGDSLDAVLKRLAESQQLRSAIESGIAEELEADKHRGKGGWAGPGIGQCVRGKIQSAIA